MKGIVFLGDRKLELQDFEDPTPGPGEVVLEIKASGMCGSDLHFYRAADGPATFGLVTDGPTIGGHEPCGIVAAIGAGVETFAVGDRVMNHHYSGCGSCTDCGEGWQQLCRNGFVVYGATAHGAHARYMAAKADTMVALPDELSFAAGAAISCGTGTAYSALTRMQLSSDDTIAIFGMGPVGLSTALFANHMGARVIAIDLSPERLALASQMGAHDLVDGTNADAVEAVLELTGGRGAEKTIDCSGAAPARAQAVRSTRTWGTCCFVGEGGTVELAVSPDILRRQLTIIGSWTFSSVGQADCARYVADRGIDLEQLFTHRFALDQANDAYELFDQQTTGKGVFEF